MSFLDTGEMAVARILVLLNVREGLKEFLNLTYLGRTRVQILDYEGIPFRCRRCHEYGHIIKDCKYSSRGHRNRRPFAENRRSNVTPISKDTSSPTTESSIGGNTNEQEASRTEEVEAPPLQEGIGMALVPVDREQQASEAGSEAIPHFLVDSFLGMHISISRPTFGFSKEFNFTMLNRGLSPTLPSLTLLPSPPLPLLPSPHPSPPLLPSLPLPEPENNTLLHPPSEDSSSEESEDSIIRYQLCNRTVSIPISEHKGLGPNPEIHKTKKGRGRNSHLYKAQSRALVDIASSRQKSIIGALRAVKTLGRVPL
jgi:hypothetical protein